MAPELAELFLYTALGFGDDDLVSRQTVCCMTVSAIVTEGRIQQRLAEMMSIAAVMDPTGGFAIANVLVDIAARQNRPTPISDELATLDATPSVVIVEMPDD